MLTRSLNSLGRVKHRTDPPLGRGAMIRLADKRLPKLCRFHPEILGLRYLRGSYFLGTSKWQDQFKEPDKL